MPCVLHLKTNSDCSDKSANLSLLDAPYPAFRRSVQHSQKCKDNIALGISWWALKCDMLYLAWIFTQAYISNMDNVICYMTRNILESFLCKVWNQLSQNHYHVCASKGPLAKSSCVENILEERFLNPILSGA